MNRKFWRWFVPLLVVACTSIALVFVYGRQRHPLDAGPLLQDVTTDAVTVVWWSSHSASSALVLHRSDGSEQRLPTQRKGTRFEVRIAGLQPSSSYDYRIEVGDEGTDKLQVPGTLRTAPLPGESLSFLVFGDSGSGRRVQYRLAQVMARHPADLILHTGDLVYRKGELRDYDRKFHRPYRELLASIPFYPVLGNHDIHTDGGRPFLDTFSLPTNGPPTIENERCYWFDYGDARFVAVDSTLPEKDLAQSVAPWVERVLLDSPLKWKIVFFHEPPWAGAYRPSNVKVRDILVPSIEVGNADVVFCGHNHLFERTHLMRKGQVSPADGVLYIITGAGGKSLYKQTHGNDPHIAAYNNKKYSFTLVALHDDQLDISQIGENNRVLDTFTLTKSIDPQN